MPTSYPAKNHLLFQHLYLLGRSATLPITHGDFYELAFQHLYLLGRSATPQGNLVIHVSWTSFNTFTFWEGLRRDSGFIPGPQVDLRFNTFTFWEGLRPVEVIFPAETIKGFQHLYLLGRSATITGFDHVIHLLEFQHLYLLGRSATFIPCHCGDPGCLFQHLYLLGRSATQHRPRQLLPGSSGVSTPLPSGKVCD